MPKPGQKVATPQRGIPAKKPESAKKTQKHIKDGAEVDVCWFFHGVYDLFGIDHKAMQNEAVVLNLVAAKLGSFDAELLLRALRALKNKETN